MALKKLGVGSTVNMSKLLSDHNLIAIHNWWNKGLGRTKDTQYDKL